MTSRVTINWWILLGGLPLLAGFLLCMGWGFSQDPRALDLKVLEGKPAPDFVLTALNGDKVRLSDLRGNPVMINFWSTWCVPCKQEHPVLQQAPDVFPTVTFLGVVYQDQIPAVRRYLTRAPVPYHQLEDPDGKVAIAFGVTGVPETYFIDADGIIVRKEARAIHMGDLYDTLTPLIERASGSTAEPNVPVVAMDEPLTELERELGPPGPVPTEAEIDERARHISRGLRCPVCQGSSIQDSPVESAVNMRKRVRQLVERGYRQDEINEYFVTRYGEWILQAPKAIGYNWLVWGLPGLGGGLALAFLALTVTRWRIEEDPVPLPSDVGDAPMDKYEEELLREISD